MNIIEIFYFVDEFCKEFIPLWNKKLIEANIKSRNKPNILSVSEVMTILILFHSSKYRDFKSFYICEICGSYKHLFPKALSFNRFIEIKKSAIVPILFLL